MSKEKFKPEVGNEQSGVLYVPERSYEVDVIPISWGIDGGTPPGALSTLTSTNKVRYRDFSGAADNDLFFEWEKPYGQYGDVFFAVEGFITNVVPPVSGETMMWALRGCAIYNKWLLSTAMGNYGTLTKVFDANWAQYDKFSIGFNQVVIAGLNGSSPTQEGLVLLQLKRDTLDSYEEAIGVSWLKIKYAQKSQKI